jgi:predicted metal-dependent hydrolase
VNTEPHQIKAGGLVVDVVRKNIKHLHLAVYPPAGRIRVAVPLRVNDEAVRLAVITRMPWINRHRRKFAGQERQSAREYVSGESHYFQGCRYRLNVVYHGTIDEQTPSVGRNAPWRWWLPVAIRARWRGCEFPLIVFRDNCL